MTHRNMAPVIIRHANKDGSFEQYDAKQAAGKKPLRRPITGNYVYKFSKKTGKNCGIVYEGERRNRSRYDYNDE